AGCEAALARFHRDVVGPAQPLRGRIGTAFEQADRRSEERCLDEPARLPEILEDDAALLDERTGLVEVAAHRVQAPQRRETEAGNAAETFLGDDLLAAANRAVDVRRPEDEAEEEHGRGDGLVAVRARAPRVTPRALKCFLRGAPAAEHDADEASPVPHLPQAQPVPAGGEHSMR